MFFFVDSSSGVDIEITGGSITQDGLLNSFKKVAEKIGSAPQTSEAGAMSATPAQAAQQAPAAPVSLQERVERAKMLVEQRKMEKQKDEDDKEKNKEMYDFATCVYAKGKRFYWQTGFWVGGTTEDVTKGAEGWAWSDGSLFIDTYANWENPGKSSWNFPK